MGIKYHIAGTVTASFLLTGVPVVVLAQSADTLFDLGTLVLSGERSQRSITDTYVGVSVIDEDRLSRTGQSHINDVLATTPNLFVEGKSELPTLRGIQGGGPGGLALTGLTGSLPRLSFVIDGVTRPGSVPGSSGGSLWDTHQVEIFRGPQSLLRGRSAIGGAIVVETRDPTFTPEAALQFGIEHDDYHDKNYVLNGMVSGPLSETIAGRFTFELADGDDPRYVESALPGDWVTEYDNVRLRGKLLGNFDTDWGGLTVKFTAEHQEGQTPQTRNTVTAPGGFATPSDRVLISPETNARTYDTETDVLSFDAILSTDVGEFQFVASYVDDSFTSVPEQTFPSPVSADEKLVTYELLYRFGTDQRVRTGEVSGLVGLHFEDRDQSSASSVLTPFGSLDVVTSAETQSRSIYTDLRYGLTDELTIFGGARVLNYDATRNQSTVAPLPLPSAAQSISGDETEFLPALGLAYYFSDTNVLSGSLRTGFNPSGVGINAFAGLPYTYDSETVTTAEITFRGALTGGNLNYGITGFYNWHDNPQFFAELVPGNRGTLQVVNQPEGISYGLELDATWQATDRLRLDAALGLLETEITEAQASNPALEGNRFGQDPDTTFSVGAVYAVSNRIFVDGRATYRGESFSDFNNTPGDVVGDYWLVDFGVTATWNNVQLRAYINNVFDEIGVTRFVSGGTFADVTAPRTLGLTLTSRF